MMARDVPYGGVAKKGDVCCLSIAGCKADGFHHNAVFKEGNLQ